LRSEIIKQLKIKNPKINKLDLESILDIFSNSIEKALKNGQNIELRGFGSFIVKKIKENKSARNPKTGQLIYVAERNKVRFRASKKLKNYVNK
tara:strand:- start:575 stop:853 length:279 start_codon:yes stop_codon:yes gene_type:complete